MLRNCDSCGRQYGAKSVRSRFCSDTCRVRHSRGAAPLPAAPNDDPPLVKAVAAELAAAGRVDTRRGQQALVLARRMSGGKTTAGLAALSRELCSLMDAAMGTSTATDTPGDDVDELRARRDAKRNARA